MSYGRHPFYFTARDDQDDRYDRDLMTGRRVDARQLEPLARLKPVSPPRASTNLRKD